jgi:hypothetical protein
VFGRDDDVRVDVLEPERNGSCLAKFETHSSGKLPTSVSLPRIAAAAAIAGETRCVRAPGPCRPTEVSVGRRSAALAGWHSVCIH